jgi:ribose transport system permease protein
MLLAGALIGAFNGLVVAWTRMPAFIVTLTVQMFTAGFAIWYAHWFGGSQSIYSLPAGFTAAGRELACTCAIALAVGVAGHVTLSRSLYGRRLYAIGKNATAAAISGVPVRGTVAWAYVLSGLAAALAAIVYTGRLATATAAPAEQRFLDVIAAAVIGGTSLFGGKGTVLGTASGVLFITVLDNSLTFLGLSLFAVLMVKGGVILAAALLDTVRVRLREAG